MSLQISSEWSRKAGDGLGRNERDGRDEQQYGQANGKTCHCGEGKIGLDTANGNQQRGDVGLEHGNGFEALFATNSGESELRWTSGRGLSSCLVVQTISTAHA